MEVIEIKCPGCKASVEADLEKNKKHKCPYCRKTFYFKKEGEPSLEETKTEEVKWTKETWIGLFIMFGIIYGILWFVLPWVRPTLQADLSDNVESRSISFAISEIEMMPNGRMRIHFEIQNNRRRSFMVYGGDWNVYIDGVSATRLSISGNIMGGATLRDYITITSLPTDWSKIYIGYTALNFRRFRFTITTDDLENITIPSNELITLEQFNQIEIGMTKEAIWEIVGGACTQSSVMEIIGTITEFYSCNGYGSIGANAVLTFQDNELTLKTELGLE